MGRSDPLFPICPVQIGSFVVLFPIFLVKMGNGSAILPVLSGKMGNISVVLGIFMEMTGKNVVFLIDFLKKMGKKCGGKMGFFGEGAPQARNILLFHLLIFELMRNFKARSA